MTRPPRPPSRRAALWLTGGLLDVEFYGALRGRSFRDDVEAAEDFVVEGMRGRLSPHPQLDFVSLPADARRAWRQARVREVLDHLTGEDGRVAPVGPLADADPLTVRGPALDLARRLGREGIGDVDPRPDAGSIPDPGDPDRRPGLVSAVVVAAEVRPTRRLVDSLTGRSLDGEGELEVVVVDPGSPPHVALGLHAALHGRPGVELLRIRGDVTRPEAVGVGVARSRGDVLFLLAAHTVVRRDALARAAVALADPEVAGVQPLLLAADDTIDSAGLWVAADGQPPVPLLRGHQKEDARRLDGEALVAISGDAMVLRATDVLDVGGLDPRASWEDATLDLCGRLLRRRPAGFRLASTALVTTRQQSTTSTTRSHGLLASPGLLSTIGFEVSVPEGPGATDRAPVVTGLRRSAPGRLRWSLKLPSGPGRMGDLWGDTHFADGVAASLRGLGHDVVTCRRGAHTAGPTHLDDVSLALRGLHPVPPTPGQVNVLWVISHPDDVDLGELDGYDVVCVASTAWSAELSARTGREVVPLLQATEFSAPSVSLPDERGAVFVGSARSRERPLVWKAVEAGVPLAVFGPGWDALPAGVWCGEQVDNDRLPELYRRHGIVLADHWPDMARHGFVANRVFDAVVSGARVISDDVLDIEEIFDPRDLRVARTAGEVSRAFEELSGVADDEDVPRPSLTFDDRARTLVELVSGR